MDQNIFKAYDIRGKYPSEINEDVVKKIISNFFSQKLKVKGKKLTVVIGRDTRLSSPDLYEAAINSLKIKNLKLKIILAGLSTTPEMYFLVNKHNADFGIMITASHNPKEYNGIKIAGPKAAPISGKEVYIAINKNLKIKV